MSDLIRSANSNFYTYHAGDLWRAGPNQLPRLSHAGPRRGIMKLLFGKRPARSCDNRSENGMLKAPRAHGLANGLW